jgi:hypothetical protein
LTSWFDVGFIGGLGFETVSYMLLITLLAKICNDRTRGTMYSLNGFIGSIVMIPSIKLFGSLYANNNRIWPFLIAYASFGIYLLTLLVLVALVKIKV